ncbi:hypothetical protein QW131_29140 [Roseibium salinum]|nr:hypothetical protein [Roseibium salinum]
MSCKNALDAAVLAGAAATEDQIAVAEQYFASNVAGHEGLKPSVEFTVGNDEVTGVASAAVGAWFVHLLGIEAIPVTVSAAAGAETSAVVCIYAVNQLESEGFKANGSGKIDMPDCEMHVHSKTSSATWIDSRHIDTKRLCVAGSLGGNARPWPDEFEGHCDVEDDPIAGTLPALSDELVAEESCVPWSAMPDENATDMVFKPGTYCYYPNINGHVQTVTFEPGDYVFKSGLTFSGKHVVFGAGNYVFKGANFQFNGSVQTVEMGAGVYVFSGGSQLRFDDQKNNRDRDYDLSRRCGVRCAHRAGQLESHAQRARNGPLCGHSVLRSARHFQKQFLHSGRRAEPCGHRPFAEPEPASQWQRQDNRQRHDPGDQQAEP